MRMKLQKFTEFANTLLPHETAYLLSTQQFEDDIKLGILKLIDYNCNNIRQFTPYDQSIDKRKYSNLKNWITERLESIDVDVRFDWMSHLEQQVMTDSIEPQEEKQLLKAIREYGRLDFYFTKFYELVEVYRHYLLIRMRYAHHKVADDFLKTYRKKYEECKATGERIHEATLDIVNQYSKNSAQSIHWENWLTEVFYNEELDGLNRYLALVRLTFVYFNYRQFEKLREKYNYIDQLFKNGQYYSRRILLNYYANRVMLHTKFQEYDKAEYYGYLSIREKNSDYIHYVNNLSAVLLRQKKYQEALQLMRSAYPEMKNTPSFHNRIGFVAFYLKCLNYNQQFKNAENYAESFLQAYKKEIFEYRWHIFFSSYLEAILRQEKYSKVLKTVRKYQLLEREKQYQKNANYLPTILWYNAVAQYKEMLIQKDEVSALIQDSIGQLYRAEAKQHQLKDLLEELRPFIPGVVNRLQDKMLAT
ncbi:MAG: hypothetical protein KDD06_12670 [Phaeodactylibacter sp.]|nr:hypothetical protein [Phaeodactylibacter sp.]MCB9266664.1 hypothetical protein [Lewinellaceae bacterium]MCB9289217.1 hypothetical protein [Lewinellaceae bacterium]